MNDDYRPMAPLITRQGEKPRNFLGGVSEFHHPCFRPSWMHRYEQVDLPSNKAVTLTLAQTAAEIVAT
jgi:hypothetical protein